MKFITQGMTRNVGRSLLLAKKSSPHLFFVGGVAGVIGSTVLACRATLKMESTLDMVKEDLHAVKSMGVLAKGTEPFINSATGKNYTEQDYYRELGHVYVNTVVRFGKLYGPALALGTISVAALTGSHVQLTRRNAALSATLAAVSKAFDDYRGRVQEEIGQDKELDIYRDIQKHELEEDGKKKLIKAIGPHGMSVYAKCFDETNPRFEKNAEINHVFLNCQQNYMNHILGARGHLFLNEVYDALGFDHTQAGSVVGWVINGKTSDNFVDFGMYEAYSAPFINGQERAIWLDFNVDGIIYDKI